MKDVLIPAGELGYSQRLSSEVRVLATGSLRPHLHDTTGCETG